MGTHGCQRREHHLRGDLGMKRHLEARGGEGPRYQSTEHRGSRVGWASKPLDAGDRFCRRTEQTRYDFDGYDFERNVTSTILDHETAHDTHDGNGPAVSSELVWPTQEEDEERGDERKPVLLLADFGITISTALFVNRPGPTIARAAARARKAPPSPKQKSEARGA